MNLAKILKDRRDAERRLELTSPKPVFNGGAADSIEGGGNETLTDMNAYALKTEVPDSLTDLDDVPTSYEGEAGKVLMVKLTADGLEFGVASSGGSGAFDYGLISESTTTSADYGGLT